MIAICFGIYLSFTMSSMLCVHGVRVIHNQHFKPTLLSNNIRPILFKFRDLRYIKVAEHGFVSLWVYVICQIMARERLQVTSWNLASEKYTNEKFSLAGKIWRFRSFHDNMNDWIQP